MKAMILAGGRGTRIAEESSTRPKPMIEIGDMPILWHIMKIYSAHGVTEFIICLGHRGFVIKDFFANYLLHRSDVTIKLSDKQLTFHDSQAEDWSITLVDTGEATQTGGRIKRAFEYLNGDDDFFLTYGDGVADIDIRALEAFHRRRGLLATVTAVRPAARFGSLRIDRDLVTQFQEKPADNGATINGGFFVLSRKVIDYIEGDSVAFEREPLENLARDGELAAFRHRGFWHPMDTLRDKHYLEQLWAAGNAPWKCW